MVRLYRRFSPWLEHQALSALTIRCQLKLCICLKDILLQLDVLFHMPWLGWQGRVLAFSEDVSL